MSQKNPVFKTPSVFTACGVPNYELIRQKKPVFLADIENMRSKTYMAQELLNNLASAANLLSGKEKMR